MRHCFYMAGVLLSTSLLLSACGGDKNTKAPSETADTATADSNTSSPTVPEQTLTINNESEPDTLDPHLAQGTQSLHLIRQFSMGLTTTDPDGNTAPGIATKWHSKDNKVWTFKLRDAKWSNDDPVTAHDFVYSFRRLADPNTASSYASYLEDAKFLNAQAIINGQMPTEELGVQALDDHTLQITLSEPIPYLPDMLIHSSVVPVHQKTIESYGDKWTDPDHIVVNGAFKPTEWFVNERIVLEKNPHFYDSDAVTLQKLVVLPIHSATTDVQRYQAGDVDITAGELPSEQFSALQQEYSDQLKIAPVLCTYFYDVNHQKPPFDNANVRRALSLALDRETITEKVLGQGQIAAYQFTPTFIAGGVHFVPTWHELSKEQRAEEAKKLLNEAGYNEENPLQFELLYDTNEQHKKIALAAVSLWQEALGFVQVNLVNQEWKAYLDSRQAGEFQMARARWCGDYNEASTFLNLKKSNNTNNWSHFANADYDALLLKTLDPKTDNKGRVQLYNQAEAILDEHTAQINVLYYSNVRLVKPYVQGYSNTDPLGLWQARYWSVSAH